MAFWHRPAITRAATGSEIVAGQLAAMADGPAPLLDGMDGAMMHRQRWTLKCARFPAIRRGEVGFLFRRDQWGFGFEPQKRWWR